MTASAMPSIVSLTPRDGLFLKDGRGWFTSESGRAGALEWPFAGTVRGALRTCLGHAKEQLLGRMLSRDEWLPLNENLQVDAVLPLCREIGSAASPAGRRWPAPRDAVIFNGEENVRPLKPEHDCGASIIPLDNSPEAAAVERLQHPSPGHISGKPVTMPPWWCDDTFTAWLCGLPVSAVGIAAAGRPISRVQTHVSIDSTTTAAVEGGLFSSMVVEPLTRADGGEVREWTVAVLGSGFSPADVQGRRVRLGGDGRYATIDAVAGDVLSMPQRLRSAFASGPQGMRMVVIGHSSFARGWLPGWLAARDGEFVGEMPGVGSVVLRAACVGRPVHVSGWDMAAGRPKPTRRLAPAGSVYFFTKSGGGAFTVADAEALWLRAIGEASTAGEATGAVVPGVWHPA